MIAAADQRGEVHPYVLGAGMIVVIFTAFMVLSEAVMASAARQYATEAVLGSLRGAARMQDFETHGQLIRPAADQAFANLLADNLGVAMTGGAGDAWTYAPTGIHPYIQGTVRAQFWVVNGTPLPTLVSRVYVPLRLPFVGPYYQRLYGQPPTTCLAVAIMPYDQFLGLTVDPPEIPSGYQC